MPKNVIGSTLSTSFHGSTDHKIISSSGAMYFRHLQETIAWTSGGLSPSSASPYGVTFISMTGTDPSTSPLTLTLGAPVPGCHKIVVLGSTAAYINTVDIDLGSGVRVDGTSDGRYIAFSSLGTDYQSVSLVGLTTAKWAVVGVNSTVGQFNAANGIRVSTAARTS
jgi:hypothetical protein